MIKTLQELKGKTKSKIHQYISKNYAEMHCRLQNCILFDEDHCAKNAQSIATIFHEVFLFMKFLQTKPQVKSMNINCYALFCTFNKNSTEGEKIEISYRSFQAIYP